MLCSGNASQVRNDAIVTILIFENLIRTNSLMFKTKVMGLDIP